MRAMKSLERAGRAALSAGLLLVARGPGWAQGSAIGEWESTTPGLGALATLDVKLNRWNAEVKAKAPCGNGTCDWGVAVGKVHYETVEGTSAFHMVSVVFDARSTTTQVLLIPKPRALLEAQVLTTFKGNDRRAPTYSVQTLKRRKPAPRAVPLTIPVGSFVPAPASTPKRKG